MWRRAAIAALLIASLVAIAALGWLWWRGRPAPEPAPPPPVVDEAPRLDLHPVRFTDLPGWSDPAAWVDSAALVGALERSCRVFANRPDDRPIGGGDQAYAGTAADWRPACDALPSSTASAAAVRSWFETRFRPWVASDRGERNGLFTGYYEPTLHGRRERGGTFRFPLYARPPELVSVDLGQFRDDLAGRRIAGRVEGNRLVPFPDRGAIDAGALDDRALELVWVDDPVDAFFLHIQGSGVVRLAEGGELRLGYAAQNGHPYRALGRVLVERGEMTLEEVSMQSLRRWLRRNPERAAEAMAANPSYVFFRILSTDGPLGSQGVVLTPGRSLAVDTTFHALGVPMWLSTTVPAPVPTAPDRSLRLRRLMVAQDTGGAIRGPVRGDVFWGPGDDAAAVAGRMRHPGRLWVLLPAHLTPPSAPSANPLGADRSRTAK